MKTFTLCSATTRLLILGNFFFTHSLFCPRVGNAAFWERAEENKSPLTYLGTISIFEILFIRGNEMKPCRKWSKGTAFLMLHTSWFKENSLKPRF